MTACPFCQIPPERIAFSNKLSRGLWDGYPVAEGHLLLVPKRHVPVWNELTREEQTELSETIASAQELLRARFGPEGFNVGFNEGAAGGQTVPHFHIHVIPRRFGDVPNPRGGVRNVIPSKGDYLAEDSSRSELSEAPHARALIAGGDDALLQHLLPHIDQSQSIDLVVSFVLDSGVRLIKPRLQELLDRGGRLRLVTGDYLDVTDPNALRRLLDLNGDVNQWIFEAAQTSFHPKSWIFHFPGDGGIAIVGSSNLSESALRSGVEWNYRLYDRSMTRAWHDVVYGFERLLERPELKPLTHEWIDRYEAQRTDLSKPNRGFSEVEPETPLSAPPPHPIQQRALIALKESRLAGFTAGLVVLATGLGKTWLSAFDSEAFQRILFVAHRDEILNQAMASFRRVRPGARFGRYTGEAKDSGADVLFASIQTLGRARHLRNFPADYFDYIIVDEFHHAAAPTYRALIEHFTPRFLLGLTATPERTDGGDLLGLCQENLVFRCDMFEGIEADLLSPFRYFGVPDDVDYAQIPWRSTAFDEAALTQALATRQRAENALEQYQKHRGQKSLGFCCSIVHADFMAQFFNDRGVRAVAVHSGFTSAPRVTALEQLQAGHLDIVFAVDILNEGVDLPEVDTILMLRPTESTIIWLQQFGRGLRFSEGKRLTVVDYIGNHRVFLTKARALLHVGEGNRPLALALDAIRNGRFTFPPGCEVTYELEALDLLQQLVRTTDQGDALEAFYVDFRQRHGVRATALEVFHAGFDPNRTGHGRWLNFVKDMGDLDPQQAEVFDRHQSFFTALSTTPMSKSYKMLLLQAMLIEDALPGKVELNVLASRFAKIAGRNPRFREDISVSLDSYSDVKRLIVQNPISAWIEAKGTGGTAYFNFDGRVFATSFSVPAPLLPAFRKLVAEILELRIAQYLGRNTASTTVEKSNTEKPAESEGPELWKEYPRQQIPAFFGTTFSPGNWNAGMVSAGRALVLLMTLKKGNLAAGNQYEDHFIDPQTFQWQTQAQTTQNSKHGRIIRGSESGYRVHLFVRPSKLRSTMAAPFIYCGEVRFVDWRGEKPITVTSRLAESVPTHLHRTLRMASAQS
jgi:superfamily II DNA or RNA helicase/diadenosine tetraphosphate (Ap4A) HIT family hydrolase